MTFLNEWFAVDMVKNQDGVVVGAIALCMETGEVVHISSKATVVAQAEPVVFMRLRPMR